MNKAYGLEAINILSFVALGQRDYLIEETNAGIDVDNAGRYYQRENMATYQDVLWNMALYVGSNIPDGYTLDNLFTVEYERVERFGNTDVKVVWFHINTEIFDAESLGTHFKFLYPAEEYAYGAEVYEGTVIDVSSVNGKPDWQTVTDRYIDRYENDEAVIIAEYANGKKVTLMASDMYAIKVYS